MTKDKNKKSMTVVKSGGTFSGTAKHRRTAMVSMTSKTTKQKGSGPSISKTEAASLKCC